MYFQEEQSMSVTDNRPGEEAEQTLGQYGYQQEFRR